MSKLEALGEAKQPPRERVSRRSSRSSIRKSRHGGRRRGGTASEETLGWRWFHGEERVPSGGLLHRLTRRDVGGRWPATVRRNSEHGLWRWNQRRQRWWRWWPSPVRKTGFLHG